MYSPSGLFQLQALQSLALGKDYTRFNLNFILRGSLAGLPSSPPRTDREDEGELLQPQWQARWLNLFFCLLADSKFLNYSAILGYILLLQVLQKPSPLTDELQQPATGMMILLVDLEMFRQVSDPITEQCNLYLR